MITIKTPSGKEHIFEHPVHGARILETLYPKQALQALGLLVDGVACDISAQVKHNATVEPILRASQEGLEILRHDIAHVLAQAVQELFPGTQVTIGPVIENGFYYDFLPKKPFVLEDLPRIEERMKEIIDSHVPIVREVFSKEDAIAHFQDKGETFKVQLIQDIPHGEDITLYKQGEWSDLCRGPHSPSTKTIGHAFKLTKISGSYWRGDSSQTPLQRIYGTAWDTPKALKKHLFMLEEAKKRDHRILGVKMQLFHLQKEAAGSVFWHARGLTLYRALVEYMRAKQNALGYEEVATPTLLDRTFWEQSGHWEQFADGMFTLAVEKQEKALKPMNCPGHIQIFKHNVRSYQHLPIRYAEFGSVYRNEPSGALHGLMRARHFTQDDAHIFCTPDKESIQKECTTISNMILSVYKDFGFHDVHLKLATRPAKRIGSDEEWNNAEEALENTVKTLEKTSGITCVHNPEEGAFYGPKIEFILKDSLQRMWQCGTIQLDFNLPKRLGAVYVDKDDHKHHPAMIHRAVFGSLERFIGMLIEHHAGWLPLWITPVQIITTAISEKHQTWAQEVHQHLIQHHVRSVFDNRSEKISFKIRQQTEAKVPLFAIIGEREAQDRTVSLRHRIDAQNVYTEVLPIEEAMGKVTNLTSAPFYDSS